VVSRTVLEVGVSEGTPQKVWVQADMWLEKVVTAKRWQTAMMKVSHSTFSHSPALASCDDEVLIRYPKQQNCHRHQRQ
jgi:hypothetical protein